MSVLCPCVLGSTAVHAVSYQARDTGVLLALHLREERPPERLACTGSVSAQPKHLKILLSRNDLHLSFLWGLLISFMMDCFTKSALYDTVLTWGTVARRDMG